MANELRKNWALTKLSNANALFLLINDVRYEVAQFTCSYALNEVPTAQCLLSIGRLGRDVTDKAQIHKTGKDLRQLRKAEVWFSPEGEYLPDGTPWPKGAVRIFDGYFVGTAYRKVNGKIQVIVNLDHWLLDLACSSCLTTHSHPSNAADYTLRAILEQVKSTGATANFSPVYVSHLIHASDLPMHVTEDFWSGLKKIFCSLTRYAANPVSPHGACASANGSRIQNTRARRALKRIEGFGDIPKPGEEDCTKPYQYGVALKAQDVANVPDASNAIAMAISHDLTESYASMSMWNKLVGQFCSQFNMAVVPMVESAIVIADLPAYNGGRWKTIEPDDYDSFDMSAKLEYPLRGVGVWGEYADQTGAIAGRGTKAKILGGCVAISVPQNVNGVSTFPELDDGIFLVVRPPRWLQSLTFGSGNNIGFTIKVDANEPQKTATQSAVAVGTLQQGPTAVEISQSAGLLFNRYAHSMFIAHGLRGRSGALGGKLRFDIAPGSNVLIKASLEKFLQNEDDLAINLYGNVNRVTIAINSESAIAGTTFVLTHLRTEAENADPRTSAAEHPLFGDSIHGNKKYGSPLLTIYDDLGRAKDEEKEKLSGE